MEKTSLFCALLSILLLLLIMHFSKAIEINSKEQIEHLSQNQKVKLSGKVVSDYQSSFSRVLKLEENITLYCHCQNIPSLKNRDISATGIIDTFQYKKIKVLKIILIQ